MESSDYKVQALHEVEAQIRDQRRLGGPTGALLHIRSKLLVSIDKAAREAQSQAQRDLLQEERWRQEHYHRREK